MPNAQVKYRMSKGPKRPQSNHQLGDIQGVQVDHGIIHPNVVVDEPEINKVGQ